MEQKSIEDRVTVLLSMLGDELADALINDLPAQSQQHVRDGLAGLRQSPPTSHELDEVLEEFEGLMRMALDAYENQEHAEQDPRSATQDPRHNAGEDEEEFQMSDDPVLDLTRVSCLRLVAALRDEPPPIIAQVINALPTDRAGEVLQQLSPELRDDVFLRLKDKPQTNRRLLERIALAIVSKAIQFDSKELAAENEDYDQRVAQILRAMERKQRSELLQTLEAQDAEVVDRLRGLMYSVDDLARMEDRSVQKMLAELDVATLSIALKDAAEEITDRVLRNMSRRAKQALLEEMDLMGSVSEDERANAERMIVEALAQLDKSGDLVLQV